jgi:hypothetical protein
LIEQHYPAWLAGGFDHVVDIELLERGGQKGDALVNGVPRQIARDGVAICGFDGDFGFGGEGAEIGIWYGNQQFSALSVGVLQGRAHGVRAPEPDGAAFGPVFVTMVSVSSGHCAAALEEGRKPLTS